MTQELEPPIVNLSDIAELSSVLRRYVEFYVTDDIRTIMLFTEGFGKEFVVPYVSRLERCLERIVLQNPILGFYLPFLSNEFDSKTADSLIKKLERHVDELRGWVKESEHTIERLVLIERRSNLVSFALASKYFLYMNYREHYDFIDFYVNTLLANTILSKIMKKYYDELDAVERTSLLYLYEVVNMIREKLSLPPLDTSQLKNYLENLDRLKLDIFTRLTIAPLLYELAKLRKDKQYLLYFYELLSHVDFHGLATEIQRRERDSARELLAYGYDEETVKALSVPLGELELALMSKLINILQKEFVYIPLVDFTNFVSKYYGVPKVLLKLCLKLKLLYNHVLKYLDHIIMLAISSILSLITWMIASFFVQITALTSTLIFVIYTVIVEALKRVQQISESKVIKFCMQIKKNAMRKIEELKRRERFFEYFVP